MANTYEIKQADGSYSAPIQAETKQAAIAQLNAPIAADSLGQTKAFNVPPTPPSTSAAGMSGRADALIQSQTALNAKADAEVAAQQKAANDSLSKLEATYNDIIGVQKSRQATEDSLNVQGLGTLSNNAFSSLQASQQAQRREVEAIMDTPGMSQDGARLAIQQLNRRYALEQADLSIQLDVANRNYLAAQQTADKKIQMQLEPLQTLLDFQKTFYQANRDDLSDAKKQQFDLKIAENERLYTERQTQLKTLETTKLQLMQAAQENQAPASIVNGIQAAQTPEEAIAAAGQYGTDMLGRQLKLSQLQTDALQRSNIQSQINERNAAASGAADGSDLATYSIAYKSGQIPITQVPKNLRAQVLADAQATGKQTLLQLLGQYRDKLDGLNWFTANLPQNSTILQTLKGQITAEYKQQEKLGTLDLGVQKLIDSIVPDPTQLSLSSLDNSSQVAAIDNFIANQGGSPNGGATQIPADEAAALRAKYNY